MTEEPEIVPIGKLVRKEGARLPSEKNLLNEITEHHSSALTHACDSVREAAKAGEKLAEAKDTIPMKSFRNWVDHNLPFSWRTAYRYIKVHEMNQAGLLDFDGINSINEALRVGEKSEEVKESKDKDSRQETFVSHALKIESWFVQENSKSPVRDWPADRRASCKNLLQGVKDIYDQFDS
tara:strand:+ start:312 stop:851 length:540 start_codon:yes stop_codon:yes gene_type:complete